MQLGHMSEKSKLPNVCPFSCQVKPESVYCVCVCVFFGGRGEGGGGEGV